MYFISGLKGALFLGAFVVLVFFLKIICPLNTGCFVDPFLVILFSPLWLFQGLQLTSFTTAGTEPYAILCFWSIVGFIVGALCTPFFTQKDSSSI